MAGIPVRCIASPVRGLPFKYEPQGRRFNGGIGRRHRRTVGVAGQLGVRPGTGVVRRLSGPCAGHKRAILNLRRTPVEIVVTGRHVQVSERFRRHLDEKLAKVPQLAPRVQRLDVVVTHEANKRQSKACDRVEITCHVKGPVVRAEACADDKYGALDIAMDKLLERLRRDHDRRRVHRGRRVPESVSQATSRLTDDSVGLNGHLTGAGAAGPDDDEMLEVDGDSPIHVREKIHASMPMGLDQALYEMELVGHDFYLFHDKDTNQPSVVYRRRGWSYGVIHLDVSEEQERVS
jgi:ribosomal subunit interface protein